MSLQDKDWEEYKKTWPEPVVTKKGDCGDCSKCFPIRANQSWRKARKTRMALGEADEFIKKLEFMPIPEVKEESEGETGGWEFSVSRSRRNGRKEKEQEVCVVEKTTKEVSFAEADQGIQMKLRFQVADVKKPLMSVKRIVEQGNHVGLGPGQEDNYILNKESGNQMPLKKNGKGSYLMEVKFVGGGQTEITVDSGAEENVCPWEWGKQFKMVDAESWMHFRDASGRTIPHHGRRDVLVESPF